MFWIWLSLIIVLILLEFSTKNCVMIFFVASSFVSLILSLFIDGFMIEFLVFVVLGTILLATLRDKLIKFIKYKKTNIKKNSPNKTKVKNEKKVKVSKKNN